MNKIKVSACIITYNHEKFIRECLEGVINQNVDFEFEIVIGEDNSSDKTRDICIEYVERYPNLIKFFPRDENLGMMGNWLKTIQNCQGSLIALCEGDDYWTDPLKLQKQVDFLENNKDYSVCWTKFNKVDSFGKVVEKDLPMFNQLQADVTVDNFFENYRTWTLTCVFKASVLDKYNLLKFKYLKDNTIFFASINDSKGKVLDFNSGCYRIHESGVWSSSSNLNRYLNDFHNYNEIKNKIVYSHSLDYIVKRNLIDAVRNLIGSENCKAVSINIFNSIFFSALTQLSFSNKMRFLKWYLIKLLNIDKKKIKEH